MSSGTRYTWLPEDEESTKLEGPRPVLPPAPPPPSAQAPKTKHVSFARSHTLTSFDVPRSRSPPRPQNQERLIDSQPTMQNAMLPSTLPMMHPYGTSEPRVLVLGKLPFLIQKPWLQIAYRQIIEKFRIRKKVNFFHFP